jgi:hypothetical protein
MVQKINSVDVEQFRGTTFFRLTPHRPGNRVKIKDPAKHAAYLAQLREEVEAKKAGRRAATVDAGTTNGASSNGRNGGPDTSKASATGTKRLLVSPALDALNEHLTATKTALCGPFGIAQQSKVLEGVYVVRNEFIETIEEKIRIAQDKLEGNWLDPETAEMKPGYLPAFLDDLPAAIERTRTLPLLEGGLGPLFEPADYATIAEDWKEAFSLDSQWLALGIPDDLPPALKAKTAEKFERQMVEAAEECKDALRCSLGNFLDNLVERLTPGEDGKPKVFRDTLIENVRQFCQVFDARNFLNDTELSDLVSKCKAVLQDPNATPEKIRQYSSVRENTAKQFQAIQAELGAMIETRKARAFDLSED